MNFDEFRISQNAICGPVSIVCEKFKGHSTIEETQSSLNELRELLRTLGLQTAECFIQNKKQLDPATILGQGKLKEIAEVCREQNINLLVFDFELSASQMRNIKEITGLDVVDRVNIILEIFALHARTKEAKLQIEISRLEYLLPRLTSLWTHFSKQKGGIGLKGEGEQQLELDRRLVRERIEHLRKQLIEVSVARNEQRKKRQNQSLTAALVGYTNAGKSSLLNGLCNVRVLAENKLFATLDSTARVLNPDTKPPMILIDTVGFISNLPSTLISGFKTTLDAAHEADLLLLVVDASDPEYAKHITVTKEVLTELGLENKKQIIIFNKRDRLKDPFKAQLMLKKYPNSFLVSSLNNEDMLRLKDYIIEYFLSTQTPFDLFVPYDRGEVHSKIKGKTNIMRETALENGIYYKIRIPDFLFQKLGIQNFVLAPQDPLRETLDKH